MKMLSGRILFPLLLLSSGGCRFAPSPTPAQSAHSLDLQRWYPDKGAQALAVAAEHGNVAEVRRLMEEDGVNPDKHFSPEGFPLLAWPIHTENPNGLKAMLVYGADPDARDPTPFSRSYPGKPTGHYFRDNAMVLAARQQNPIYLRYLLDHGGDPNTRSFDNETLIYRAFTWEDQWQNVRLLIERGAEINEPNPGGVSGPIIEQYAKAGWFQRVFWLLSHGADPGLEFHGVFANPQFSSHASSPTIEAIFWSGMGPEPGTEWRIKCQRWLVSNGFSRPPMPLLYRMRRADLGFETEKP
jgi:uncharacterized protein